MTIRLSESLSVESSSRKLALRDLGRIEGDDLLFNFRPALG